MKLDSQGKSRDEAFTTPLKKRRDSAEEKSSKKITNRKGDSSATRKFSSSREKIKEESRSRSRDGKRSRRQKREKEDQFSFYEILDPSLKVESVSCNKKGAFVFKVLTSNKAEVKTMSRE